MRLPSTQDFSIDESNRIFQIPLEEFPGFWGYAYLVMCKDPQLGELRVLIDTGSGLGSSNDQLEAGIQAASADTGKSISLDNLTHILITHGHIDHFGGLSYICPRTHALLGVHELDRRILTNYEERLAVIARRLDEFLIEAGVEQERRIDLLNMYRLTKSLFHSVNVDFTFEAHGMQLGPFEFLHVPGHSAGHVVIRFRDILFSGDHVLETISPHQSPEHLTLGTGLDHYLNSLAKLKAWDGDIRLALGGHKEPIRDLNARVDEISKLHQERLSRILELLETPRTIEEVSHLLFGDVNGYNVLLALEETGAHIEYLYQRGSLGIANLADLEECGGAVPIRYYRLMEN